MLSDRISALPKRIQLRRTKGWRKPAGAVVVSRPSKWGNPFRFDPELLARGVMILRDHVAQVLESYESHVKAEVAAGRLDLSELAGKDLCCWCKPGAPCHADVLLRLANRKER